MSDDEVGDYSSEEEAPAPTKKRKDKSQAARKDVDFEGASEKKSRGLNALAVEERDRLVSHIVRYLIFATSNKIVSRVDISHAVLQNYPRQNILDGLMPLVKSKLNDLFGWELIVVPSFTPKGKFLAAGKLHYLIRKSPEMNNFLTPIASHLTPTEEMSFLMIVLSIIFMSGFAVDEEVMWDKLTKCGITKGSPVSPILDQTPEKLLILLTKQSYIRKEKVKEVVGAPYEYTIGPRALLEIGKYGILKFICDTCDAQPDPNLVNQLIEEQSSFLPVSITAEDEPQAASSPQVDPPHGIVTSEEPVPAPAPKATAAPRRSSRR